MTTQDSHDSISTYTEPSGASSSELLPLLMRLMRIFRHRKKVILTTLYCFILAGAGYYCLAPRYYQSFAKLLIVEQRPDQLSAVGEHDNTDNTMATHRELVTSHVVISKAIENLAPQHRIDLQGISPKEWVETIAKRLSAGITRKTNIIDVSYRSLNPETAATVVNSVIQSYLEFVGKNHKGSASEKIAALAKDRDQIQGDLSEKQAALQDLRHRIGHLSTSPEDGIIEPMIQRVIHLNDSLLETQENRLNLQATLISVEQAVTRGEDISQLLMGVEATLGREMLLASMGMSTQDRQVLGEQQKKLLAAQQDLNNLSTDYGPNHPDVLELQAEVQTLQQYLSNYHTEAGNRMSSISDAIPSEIVLNMLHQSVRQAEQKEKQLQETFQLARAEAASHSDALVQIRMLERDISRNEAREDELSIQIATFDYSRLQAPIRATVVREPLPDELPISPQLRFVVVACLLVGTITGGLIAYVQDILDDRFNSPEELSSQLGVPVLAMVRNLDPLPGEGLATVHTNAMPNAAETEAFRTLRTSLSVGGTVCDRILISSSEPGDGKTTISANLSVAFAQAGKRTLVIDADLRRPGFTALINLKGVPGVADVLASEEPPASTAPPLIQHTEVEGLDILPVGLRRPNPAELLSSKAFVELLAWADSQYDRVIVDCPPVLAVSDAQIVGQLVDGAILVVRPEKNHRRSVMRAVDAFHASGCNVLGVVANGLSEDSVGYGYGYGYGYGDGYGHSTEDSQPLPTTYAPDSDTNLPLTPTVPVRVPDSTEKPPTTIRPRRAA